MVSRQRSTVVVCAVLILGGAVGGWTGAGVAPGDSPLPSVASSPPALHVPTSSAPLHAAAAVRAATSSRPELDAVPVSWPIARRPRVKRRRVRGAVRLPARPDAPGPHRPLRSPAADRLRGGRALARARVGDRAARGWLPACRSARLGRSSTWCTSVPPPPGFRLRFA